MESIRKIYKIGHGPSSSHTMGSMKAAEQFKERTALKAVAYRVTLYGSLAATGKGHLTDQAILHVLQPTPTEIDWQPQIFLPFHPNGMKFEALDNQKNIIDEWIVYSVGGGDLANENSTTEAQAVYSLNTANEILQWCEQNNRTIWEYVEINEGIEIWDYLAQVWQVMTDAIKRGLNTTGVLPGGLHLPRKAAAYYIQAPTISEPAKSKALVYAYALAIAEENASGGCIATAPTCGSAGVVPAALYHLQQNQNIPDGEILRALAIAGVFGNIVKTNASIAGADVGCQGEIGTACAMAAAAASYLLKGTSAQIEYAAEMGLEHHLGLTCDPVCGLVQIPCIERNAFAAVRALDASLYSSFSDGHHFVSFDQVVNTLRQTGHDLLSIYKETAEGGLAKFTSKPDEDDGN